MPHLTNSVSYGWVMTIELCGAPSRKDQENTVVVFELVEREVWLENAIHVHRSKYGFASDQK